MERGPEEPEENVAELAHELRLVAGELYRRVRTDALVDPLTTTQFSLLARLEREGPTSAVGLAAAEHITTQAVGQALAALERKGLLTRRPHATDGRRIVAETMVQGHQLVEHSRRSRESWIANALGRDFTSRELHQLVEAVPLLRRLVDS